MNITCKHKWKKNSGLNSIRCIKCKWFLDRLYRAKCNKCFFRRMYCKTRENSNFLKNGKMVISVKIRNFYRSRMTKRTSSLESSHEI